MVKNKIRKSPKEALAVFALIQANREGINLTCQELADFAGCSRTSLNRMPEVMNIRATLKALGKVALPRGSKTVNKDSYSKTATLEAWYNADDEEEPEDS